MNLGAGLSGLSAVYPAYTKQRTADSQADITDSAAQDAKRTALAKVAMGNALAMLSGGGQGNQVPGQPQGQPQPPMPGQGSQPMQQPGMAPPGGQPPMPGGQPMPPQMGAPQQPGMQPGGMPRPPMAAPGPAPGGGGLPGAAPQGAPGGLPPQMGGQRQGALDWRQLVQAVKQSNPNLPPDVMAEAVNQFLPLMGQQSQQEWRQVSLQVREEAVLARERQVSAQIASREKEGAANRDSREGIVDTQQAGAGERAAAKREQQDKQFQQREQRLQESLKLREDSTWARLEQQKQQAEQRVQASQGKQGLAELKAAIDAQDKHVRTRIQAYSQNNTMKPDERKKMLDQADKDYEEQMAQMRQKFGRDQTGVAPAGSTAPKEQGRAPQGDPNDRPPPEALQSLKEGQVTTFNNGQKWTLKNGQPERVP